MNFDILCDVKLCKMGGGVYNLNLGYNPINSLYKIKNTREFSIKNTTLFRVFLM